MYIDHSVCRGRGGIPCIFTTLCVEVGRYTMYILTTLCLEVGRYTMYIDHSVCRGREVYHVY